MTEEIKNGNLNNIDDLLLSTYQEEVPSFLDTTNNDEPIDTNDSEPLATDVSRETIESEDVSSDESSDVDEYGTEISKPEKVYTKAEVEAMIRDRVSRLKQTESQQPDSINNQTNDIPEGDWEAQLESFIDQTLSKREKNIQQQEWKQKAHEDQLRFEEKFNNGVEKYPDFESVVYGKALTPQMVMATRGMSDPAAFIYAAAKTQAKELERISSITDTYAQAVEMGQLAERMRKSRSQVSKAPKPINAPKGDISEKVERTRSIDDKLQLAEKHLREQRMRR